MEDLGLKNSAKMAGNLNPAILAQKLDLTEAALARALRRIHELEGQKLTDLQLGFVLQEQLAGLQDQIGRAHV